MNKLYLIFLTFSLFFIGFEPSVAQESQEINREKRAVTPIVVAIITTFGPLVYQTIQQSLKKKRCGKKIDPTMVNNHYNHNMANAQALKNAVSSRMAQAGSAIHMKASGYTCDNSYCAEMGPNVSGTLGICNREFCRCKDGFAALYTCGTSKVYDPMYNRCSTTQNAILCH